MAGEWSFGINDAAPVAWAIVGAYAIAAIRCWEAYRAMKKSRATPTFPVWVIIAIVLALLGINKQLDFHTLLLIVTRDIQSDSYVLVGLAIALLVIILIMFAGMNAFRSRMDCVWDRRMILACSTLVLLLVAQFLRFTNKSLGSLLEAHPFGEIGIWHVHVIVLVELVLVLWLAVVAGNASKIYKTVSKNKA
jgi:hypothetical protein